MQGPFDLVILSAGISATGRFETISLDRHQYVTAVDLAGFARSLRRPMRKREIAVQIGCPGPMDTPHATRDAPEGASAKGRLAPVRAAEAILNARSSSIIPGTGPKLLAVLGRLAPQTLTRLIGRVLFAKLK